MNTLSIVYHNVEHFNGHGGIDKKNKQARRNRVELIAKNLAKKQPHVFALSEVEGSLVFSQMTELLPNYVFNITEGRQTQEILVGVKHGITAFFTQRNEFKRSNPHLRPSALLTLNIQGKIVSLLFSHLKSMPSPEGFGLRDAMFEKAFSLKKALDKASRSAIGKNANFIILGDMNTMGMNYEGKEKDISGELEIQTVARRFGRRKMKHLVKNHPTTYNNGSTSKYPPADLDHVFAADHLQFKEVSGGGVVDVGGWAKELTPEAQDAWINKYSDHAPISLSLKL